MELGVHAGLSIPTFNNIRKRVLGKCTCFGCSVSLKQCRFELTLAKSVQLAVHSSSEVTISLSSSRHQHYERFVRYSNGTFSDVCL